MFAADVNVYYSFQPSTRRWPSRLFSRRAAADRADFLNRHPAISDIWKPGTCSTAWIAKVSLNVQFASLGTKSHIGLEMNENIFFIGIFGSREIY